MVKILIIKIQTKLIRILILFEKKGQLILNYKKYILNYLKNKKNLNY